MSTDILLITEIQGRTSPLEHAGPHQQYGPVWSTPKGAQSCLQNRKLGEYAAGSAVGDQTGMAGHNGPTRGCQAAPLGLGFQWERFQWERFQWEHL